LTTKATSSEDAGQQFFITNKMRNVLEEELGFLPNERASSSNILPEPDAVDAPFPTNQFFPKTDAGDDGAPG
jgi:hypothetical protein